MFKTYKLLKYYKHWKPRTTALPDYGFSYAQKGTKNKNNLNNENWPKLPSVMNVARRDTLGITIQTKRGENTMTKKTPTKTIRSQMKNNPE